MAKIVLGMGASHGPLLATPPEQWGGRVEADRRNPALAYRDGTFKFDELAKLRAKENLERQIELPVIRTTTSRGSRISGSGTDSRWSSRP